tara:strand:+ start:259 stop:942 length:684 start_codon:yes stop_codon:yes gene_type:complete
MTILEITTNQSIAGKALIENGFKEVSNWFNDNIYSKDGENYKIAHPVWTKDLKAVRVEKRESNKTRLQILEKSLENKNNKFDNKLQDHFDDVKRGNGQPMNDKRNGQSTLNRWDKQNSSLSNLKESIKKTENAITREQHKIIDLAQGKKILPEPILELIEKGELKQWAKHPTILFVTGVDKARLKWDNKRKMLIHSYSNKITDDGQWKIFSTTFNSLKKSIHGSDES